MQEKDYISEIAAIHNMLIEISVKGDDAIRMAQVLQKCRMVVAQFQKDSSGSDGS